MQNMGEYETFIKKIPQMALNLLGLKFSRFMLFTVNAGFMAVATLFFIGAAIVNGYYSIWIWIGCEYIVTTLTIVGLVMVVVAMFGHVVATKESARLTKIYWMTRLLLLILELNAVISIFIMQASLYTKVESIMVQTIGHSGRWESLQTRFECCGVHGRQDWIPLNVTAGLEYRKKPDDYNYNSYRRSSTEKPDEVFPVVPYSCCSQVYFKHSKPYCGDTYGGCVGTVTHQYIEPGLVVLGITAAVAIMLEVCGIVFAFLYARNIRRLEEAEAVKDK